MSTAGNPSDSDEARCIDAYKEALKTAHKHADAAISEARNAREAPASDSRLMKLAGFRKPTAINGKPTPPTPPTPPVPDSGRKLNGTR